MTLFIFEGVDGSGKSTLAKRFSEESKIPLFQHIPDFYKYIKKPEFMSLEEKVKYFALKSFDWNKNSMIVERFFVTYLVYNDFYKRKSNLSYLNPYEDFPAENCKIIYLFADVDTLAKRIKGKNDNFPINKLPKVLDLYEKWLLSFSFYDICRIDSGKFTVDESIEILKDLVRNR